VLKRQNDLDLPGATENNTSLSPQKPVITAYDQQIDNTVAGFNPAVVKSSVANFTARLMQRRLRDSERNNTFRKVAVQETESARVLLCESDDIVLVYSCQSQWDDCAVHWFVKQDERRMSSEDRVKLTNLRKGRSIDNTEHTDIQARAQRVLQTLRGLIKFYLG
jgi:hypothetical protein